MCRLTCVSCQACNFFLFEPMSSPSLPPPYPVVLTRLLDIRRLVRGYYYLLEGAVSGHLGLLLFHPRSTQSCSGWGRGVLTVAGLISSGFVCVSSLFVWITWLTHGVCYPICSIVYCSPAPLFTLLSHHGLLLLPSTPVCSGRQIPSSSSPLSSLLLLCPVSFHLLPVPSIRLPFRPLICPPAPGFQPGLPCFRLHSPGFTLFLLCHHHSLMFIAGLAYLVVLGLHSSPTSVAVWFCSSVHSGFPSLH